jgi:hypothetical protein
MKPSSNNFRFCSWVGDPSVFDAPAKDCPWRGEFWPVPSQAALPVATVTSGVELTVTAVTVFNSVQRAATSGALAFLAPVAVSVQPDIHSAFSGWSGIRFSPLNDSVDVLDER